MDIISVIALLAVVAAPLALLSGWFVHVGYGGLSSLVGRGDRDDWWRATMPWPHGVQEEDGVVWHVSDHGRANESAELRARPETPDDALRIEPVHPRSRVVLRSTASSRRPHP